MNPIPNLNRDSRIQEIRRSDLYRRRSRHHKGNGILSRTDASQSHDGNLHSLRHLPHHPQGYRLHSRTTQTTSIDTQQRLTALDINSHSHQGVDERHTVGTLPFYGLRNLTDIRHVGRELHDERLVITGTHGLHHTRSPSTGHTKGHTTVFHVRTTDIQLYRGNLVQRVDAGCTFGIVLWRRTADIDDHIRIDILNLRIDMLTEVIDTLVLQSHAVEHP